MRRLFWHWIVSAAALLLASLALQHGVKITPWYHVLWLAPLLGLVNVLVGGLARVLSWFAAPVNLLTLGCFGFILSFLGYVLAIQYLAHALKEFDVVNFWWAAALAVVMALFGSLLNMVLPKEKSR